MKLVNSGNSAVDGVGASNYEFVLPLLVYFSGKWRNCLEILGARLKGDNDDDNDNLITGAGELQERWRRLRRRKPTATISYLGLKYFLRPFFTPLYLIFSPLDPTTSGRHLKLPP